MRRALAVAWLVAAVAVWNGFFDLYVSLGTREYLQKSAEYAAGLGPEPAMDEVMATARRDGVILASLWAALVLGLGVATWRLAGRGPAADRARRTP